MVQGVDELVVSGVGSTSLIRTPARGVCDIPLGRGILETRSTIAL